MEKSRFKNRFGIEHPHLLRFVRAFEVGVSRFRSVPFRAFALRFFIACDERGRVAAVEKVHGCKDAKVSRLNEINQCQSRARLNSITRDCVYS